MEREIKFRGKPIGKGGIWLEGIGAYKSYTAEHLVIDAKGNSVEVVYLCQYTGLKDKNGNKVFEGDILKTPRGNIGQIVFGRAEEECKHREYGRMITDVYTTYGWCFRRADGYICAIDDSILDGELIGNIYDNPNFMRNCKDIQR